MYNLFPNAKIMLDKKNYPIMRVTSYTSTLFEDFPDEYAIEDFLFGYIGELDPHPWELVMFKVVIEDLDIEDEKLRLIGEYHFTYKPEDLDEGRSEAWNTQYFPYR